MVAMSHVLLISRCPPWPLHLGDRLIIWHLARELAQRGHVIDLLAFANRPEDHDEISRYRAYFGEVELITEPARSQLDYMRRLLLPPARFPQAADQAWSPSMWRSIAQRVDEHSYDCAHFFGGVQVYEFRKAVGDLAALIVPTDCYSLYLRRELSAQTGFAPGARLRLHVARRYEAWMFTPFQRRVVVAERDRAELLGINPALHWEVIPNGVDLDYFHSQQVPRKPATLLFTGNYDYAPNEEAALFLARELLPTLRQQLPEAQLWLVGNAPSDAMRALAGEHILVSGHVPDLRPWLARASLYISPLRLGSGIKNKVLEALAAGCPLLATPLSVDGIAVAHGQHALLAQRGDMPAAALALLRDEALQQRLARAGRQLVEAQYSWDQAAARYSALYEAIGAAQAR